MGALVVAYAWLALYVHAVFAGNWTGLFLHGRDFPLPSGFPGAASTHFIDGPGYDGQFYRFIAHDPFFEKGYAGSIDAPRLRYRRILVPGLAWLLAGGNPAWIDRLYVAIQLAFLGLGVWWLGNFALIAGRSWLWGLAFAAMPVTALALTRNLVDGALAALCVGFACYVRRGARWRLVAILAAAALCRETGGLLVAGSAIAMAWAGRWMEAGLAASAGLPALGWSAFVSAHAAPFPQSWLSVPFSGWALRLATPKRYELPPAAAAVVQAADALALLGVVAAVICALWLLRRGPRDPIAVVCVLFAGLAASVGYSDAWNDLYAFGRWLAPLFALIALAAIERHRWIYLMPSLALFPRLALEFAQPILDIARWLSR